MNIIFRNNLESLKRQNKNLYKRLIEINDYKNYEIYQGEDEADINYINIKVFKPVYDKPVNETLSKIEEFSKDYQNYPILYFFGLGNGIFYKMLFANPKLERVVVFEPDIEIIYLTLQILDLSELLSDKRLLLIYTKDYYYPNAVQLLEDWDFRFYLKTYDLHVLTPFYSIVFQQEIVKVNELNVEAIKQIVISHGNDATDSLIGIKHSFHNISQMVQNYKFKNLLKQKNSDVAIIVSTGPSLTKQLPLLKKVAPYATLISVDASLPILEREGIKPDIVCVLERVEATSKFFVNVSDEFMKDINFVIASLAHEKTINEIKGKKIITMRPFPYNRFLELGEFGYIGIGMSAANMAFELAYNMKFNTTIFIGQDLAYGENESHAKGHIFGEDEVIKKETQDFYVEAYGGKGKVKTYKFWNIFRQTFEKDIFEVKDKMVVINSTEGGARIHGALELPFYEVIKNFTIPKRKIELKKTELSESINYLEQAIIKIKEGIEYGQKEKNKFEQLFLEVAKMWEELVFLNKTNQLTKINFNKLLELSDKIDEIKVVLNEEIFQKLFFDILQPFLINKELELATILVKPINTEFQKQARIIDWIMKHKDWLFSVAGSLDTQLFVMKEELEYNEKELQKLKNQTNF